MRTSSTLFAVLAICVLSAGCEGCDPEPPPKAPEVTLPILGTGWHAAIAKEDAPVMRLLDASEAGWGALIQGRSLSALTAFMADGVATPLNRIGASRAALELASHFDHLGTALTLVTQDALTARARTGRTPALSFWIRMVGGKSASQGLNGSKEWTARFAQARALANPIVPSAAVEISQQRCAQPATGEVAVRRRFLDCAIGKDAKTGLIVAQGIDWNQPDWQLNIAVGEGEDPVKAPVFDPTLAKGLSRMYAALASELACGSDRTPADAYLCGLAARRLGDSKTATAAMKTVLAAPTVDVFPIVAFNGGLDGLSDLRAIAQNKPKTPAVCARAPVDQTCDELESIAEAGRHLSRMRRRMAFWIDEHPARAAVLNELKIDDGFTLGRTNDLAAAYLRVGDVVSAGAILRMAPTPFETVDEQAQATLGGTWRFVGLQIETAVRTKDAQLAWRLATIFAKKHGAWIGARESIQLWGLSLNRSNGSTKTE